MKVAYVHDWLVTYRGGEKVLESLLSLYPDAPVYTLFYETELMPESINKRNIIYPKHLQIFKRFRKVLLPIYPLLIEAFPLEKYDLVISTSSCVAKGVMTGPTAHHISYIHSPMRYIWDQREHYMGAFSKIPGGQFLFHLLSSKLRVWDVTSTNRVNKLIANSGFVSKRIKQYYGRPSTVIHPPIATERFKSLNSPKEDYFLAAGAFVSYKRFDLAIEACKKRKCKLIIAGSGPLESHLREIAGPETTFVIAPSPDEWSELFNKAQAFIFPGVEDFGMTAIESIASGTPVIAYKKGGALDFIVEGESGLFFEKPTADSLAGALAEFEATGHQFDKDTLRSFADQFSTAAFLSKFKSEIHSMMQET